MSTTTEPVAVGAAFVGFGNAVLAFVVLLGLWHATPEQLAGAALVLNTGTTLGSAIFVRRRVTPKV